MPSEAPPSPRSAAKARDAASARRLAVPQRAAGAPRAPRPRPRRGATRVDLLDDEAQVVGAARRGPRAPSASASRAAQPPLDARRRRVAVPGERVGGGVAGEAVEVAGVARGRQQRLVVVLPVQVDERAERLGELADRRHLAVERSSGSGPRPSPAAARAVSRAVEHEAALDERLGRARAHRSSSPRARRAAA